MSITVLVTGGAGYIGSHTCRHLLDAGCKLVVLDNFYSGHRWAVPEDATLVEGDVANYDLVRRVLREHEVGAVIHFAGHIVVPESVREPLKYYRNNTVASCHLLQACLDTGVDRFIFSSTAAVYGNPASLPVAENAPTQPITPYGTSKLMTEWVLRDVSASRKHFRYVALRYFNVAGARSDGTLGQATPEATHLIKVACEAACGLREGITIYGTNYPTPDGTCIRDFIHVDDLAVAHVAALRYLGNGGDSQILNCGYGSGFSVRQVIETIRDISGADFPVTEGPRRAGDSASLIANAERIRTVLAWKPRMQDIRVICQTAYDWEKTYLRMRRTARQMP